MATSIDGHLLKKMSTPLGRLITEGYLPDENNQWDLVNVGFLLGKLSFLQGGVDADLLALFTMLSNAMGVKMVLQDVPLLGLSSLPDLPTYQLKHQERLLLINQNNGYENGFYEWQIGNILVRLWDWRDIVPLRGINIAGRFIEIKLLEYLALPIPPLPQIPPRNDNFLQFDSQGNLFARIAANAVGLKLNADRELYIDGAELGGGGSGGVSILDVANPYIYTVTGATVLQVGTAGTIDVNGDCFRTAATLKTSLVCEGFNFGSINYMKITPKLIRVFTSASNLIGIHDIVAKNLTLTSEDSGKQTFTVLGSAVIDTVLPKAKRGVTTYIVVTGEGFALLSQFAANNSGISILLVGVSNRLEVLISVTVANGVNSGFYNLVCTNEFNGISFDSGTSGNNKLEIFGDPFITTVFRSPEGALRLAEVLLGETMEITCNGFDLTNDFAINPNIITNPNGIIINLISGLSTKKFINVTGSSNIADIGVYDLTCNDTINSGNSGTTGHGKVALNYAYSATNIRLPQVFRAFGGAFLSDWLITQNVGSVTVERIGGSGMAYLEANDLFLVASLLNFTLGNFGTNINFTVETLANDMPLNDGTNGVTFFIAPIGAAITNPQSLAQVDNYMRIYNDNGQYKAQYPTFTQPIIIPDMGIRCDGNTNVPNETRFTFFNNASLLPNGTYNRIDSSHQNRAAYIAMSGNFKLNFHLKGWIGE